MPRATLDPKRVRAVLLWPVAAFTVLTLASRVMDEWTPGSVTANALHFFDASVEGTIPTFFSALLLLASAGLLATIASGAVRCRVRWWLLAAVLAFLALDEAAALHEASGPPLRRLLDAGGALYYTWVIPAAFFVVALIPAFRPLVGELSRGQRRLFLTAAVMFFGSALGFELIEGWLAEEHGEGDATLIPLFTAEEAFEMTGAVLFLSVLVDVLSPSHLTLRFERGA